MELRLGLLLICEDAGVLHLPISLMPAMAQSIVGWLLMMKVTWELFVKQRIGNLPAGPCRGVAGNLAEALE